MVHHMQAVHVVHCVHTSYMHNSIYMVHILHATYMLHATCMNIFLFTSVIFSLQTSPRKTRKRPYSLVLFIPVGAGAALACTR